MATARPTRSSVWEFFSKTEPKKVRCKLCNDPVTVLAYHCGTTSMRNHLASHHKDEYAKVEAATVTAPSQTVLGSFMSKKDCSPQRVSKITCLIAEMVARDLRPISVVEGTGFTNLLSFLEPGYKVPSHTHITKIGRDRDVW